VFDAVVQVGDCTGVLAHPLGVLTSATAPITLDDGPDFAKGDPVLLAGFGLSGPLAREAARLRVVNTTVVRAAPDSIEAGSATATACRGDSGGPVLVERGGVVRVAGVMHGTDGVICGSAVEVTPVRAHRAWLMKELGGVTIGLPVAVA
jgi:hypothetical protein